MGEKGRTSRCALSLDEAARTHLAARGALRNPHRHRWPGGSPRLLGRLLGRCCPAPSPAGGCGGEKNLGKLRLGGVGV